MIVMLDVDALLLIILAFAAGILGATLFGRLGRFRDAAPRGGYGSRMKEYEDLLVDLMIRLDTLEMRSGQSAEGRTMITSQHPPSASQGRDASHSPAPIHRMIAAQDGKGMVEYVLKLLTEGPKTSRQIEALIGRSREHTARMMKKLFEMGYVTRDSTSKPYAYSITDAGRAVVTVQQQERQVSATATAPAA